MPFCPGCGKEVSQYLGTCPYCGKSLRIFRESYLRSLPPEPGRSMMPKSFAGKLALLLGVLILAGFLIVVPASLFLEPLVPTAGTTGGSPLSTGPAGYQSAWTTSPTPTPFPDGPEFLRLGDSAGNSERQVIVFTARKTRSYQYFSEAIHKYLTNVAEPGKVFLICEGEVKNLGEDEAYVGAGDFSLSDSEGNRYDPDILSLLNDALPYYQDLYKGEKISGSIVFVVPESSGGHRLSYDFGNILTGADLATWDIPFGTMGPSESTVYPGSQIRWESNTTYATPVPAYTTSNAAPKFSWGDIIQAGSYSYSRYVIRNENMATSGNYIVYKLNDCPNPESVVLSVAEVDRYYAHAGHMNPDFVCN
ncbi:MAG: DUF4352 domain-containing protein [Methanoregulaceae archaeon]|nr:DUF4352 domain-containing protein [Methanoregulaceae archaeon]